MLTLRGRTGGRPRDGGSAARVGLFGNLGSGNLGNDGSLEAVLDYLRLRHPDAVIGFMCSGPEQVTARYRAPAVHLRWSQKHERSGVAGVAVKVLGKGVDVLRTAAWVRRFDVVIVPGMGVLEASVPLRPWTFPYSLFLMCAAARLSRTRVALVGAGAEVIGRRSTRWLITGAARLAHYRSYRDALSKESMAAMGVDTSDDPVHPDLVFALPAPPAGSVDASAVGVGVMAYHGGDGDGDRARATQIHAAYLDAMKRFVRWLVDNHRRVHLFTGDHGDAAVVAEIVADLRAHRPGLDASRVVAAPATTSAELMAQMSTVATVVATRYHNVLCAVKLNKPTLSVGYAAKHEVLMAEMGLGGFSQPADRLDVDRMVELFTELESRRAELADTLAERNLAASRCLERQFADLSAALFPPAADAVTAGRRLVTEGGGR